MYFSEKTLAIILASLHFIGGTQAATVPLEDYTSHRTSRVVSKLDNDGKLEWEDSGMGRVTHIPASLIDDVPNERLSLQKRRSWENIGRYADLSAHYQCEKGGDWGVSEVMKPFAKDACAAFLASNAAGTVSDNSWVVWQNKPVVIDEGGRQSHLAFKFLRKGPNPPPLTEDMCLFSYNHLTTDICQSDKNRGKATQGGVVEIGDGKTGSWQFGVDPGLPGERDY